MNILILSPIDEDALGQLRRSHDVRCAIRARPDQLPPLIRDRQVLVFRSGVEISAELMARAPRLELLVRAGSGCDNVDLSYVRQRGIEFVRIPQPGAKAVAELAFALMLGLARNLLAADRLLRQGRWAKYELPGYLLSGKVLGIVGVGNIGSQVGRLGAAWGMEAIGCVEHSSAETAARLQECGVRQAELGEVLAASDFVSLHVPLSDSTRHLIDAAALSQMRDGAFLVNLARGGVVDELALLQALKAGKLRGAALDVHQSEGEGKISPLANLPNVILTPHIGAATMDSQREIGARVVSIVQDFAERFAAPAACGAGRFIMGDKSVYSCHVNGRRENC